MRLLKSKLRKKSLFWDMKYFLTDHNLNYTDKLSMAAGVEARVPFLDVDLVNFSTQVPVGLKMKGGKAKYILKKMAEKYLPKEVIYRPKTGFGAPVRKWITKDLEEMINDRLSEKRINERGIFDSKKISRLIQDNKNGKIDASYSIWGLLAIESWMEQFVD
jgi:asparagine synthase (glutamine-hydrolysing)